ncbi:MAG: D-alanyl-D-alanine carboxypeptidase [Firmicutes bacterium]|nr:D-alanyl-D-alanine carboxypeptidase [Bacillota bacterium]HXL03861.1 D-alanyl-D-alanine carboxypeptidase family protein [Bacillota bacterium]
MIIRGKALLFAVICICVAMTVPEIMGKALFLPVTGRLYTRTREYPEVVYVPNYTEGPYLAARSAVLIEATTGTVVYGKNEHMRMHPASTTKIMTALLAIELGDTESTVIVSGNAASIPGSSLWLKKGQEIKLGDLIRGTMLRSGNDGCVAIAEHIAGREGNFVRMMNLKARKLGAMNTRFANPHGLTDPNHYSTAFDLALMARYGLKYPLFADIVSTREAEVTLTQGEFKEKRKLANTNWLLWSFEGADGVKTGTTAAAGYCLVASATRRGVQFISVVLDSDARWSDSARLLSYGFDRFHVMTFAEKGRTLVKTQVKGGMAPEVSVMAEDDMRIVVPRDLAHLIEEKIVLDEPLIAPVVSGQTVGRLVIMFDKDELAGVDLVAEESVAKLTLPRLIMRKLEDTVRRPRLRRISENCGGEWLWGFMKA